MEDVIERKEGVGCGLEEGYNSNKFSTQMLFGQLMCLMADLWTRS